MLTSGHMVVNCYCAGGFGTVPENQSFGAEALFISTFLGREERASFLMDSILLHKPRPHVYLMNIMEQLHHEAVLPPKTKLPTS